MKNTTNSEFISAVGTIQIKFVYNAYNQDKIRNICELTNTGKFWIPFFSESYVPSETNKTIKIEQPEIDYSKTKLSDVYLENELERLALPSVATEIDFKSEGQKLDVKLEDIKLFDSKKHVEESHIKIEYHDINSQDNDEIEQEM